MNKLQNFTNGIFNLDVKVEGEEVLFSAEQVAKSLGFEKIETRNGRTTKSIRWSRVNSYLPNSSEVGKGSFISEPMVYKLAFKANNAVSEKFTDWLAVEVLPTIRKHGAYMTDAKAQDVLSGNGLADLLLQAGNQIKKLESEKATIQIENQELVAELEEVKEKTTYLDLILESPDDILITQIAQDYGFSAVKFNRILNDLRIQRKVNKQWVLYSRYMGKGYIGSRTQNYVDKQGRERTSITTTWKQKGRKFLYETLKKNGYLPLVEQDDLVS
ncbi:phage antirepressor KilAC domain-containing protein [Lactococcus petauri]|uniref:phage antirepressor KilAC domain-containing protein n=1 Tax=Lactococcus petauri TaxID=1940789 RepID=UPI0027FECCAC|nr:phage antirepressor KilAC domain-containing protein [Lactococcus petauri]MDQ7119753.1 phage antirepressor KilAC domain-containing protein [Lactococcus petauri]MDQ7125386.1 phage antirepressor KilAC domain-containing protein [Lactococcus petauri]MDQ7126365.1 phage antirepressor KilAC domain-containing protein [Lactococcus petauri]MDQ7128272.1 phage antirepressor KilAC domain-containing protein [Lactococcus petauri]MDQ7138106.1 phage antirepressor KilAC domain-containing protein [Lactococcus 